MEDLGGGGGADMVPGTQAVLSGIVLFVDVNISHADGLVSYLRANFEKRRWIRLDVLFCMFVLLYVVYLWAAVRILRIRSCS